MLLYNSYYPYVKMLNIGLHNDLSGYKMSIIQA